MSEELSDLLDDHELLHLKRKLKPLLLPSIRISPKPAADNEIKIGGSKFGGHPDLPPGQPWPNWQGIDLPFLAQINLADVASLDSEKTLPRQGTLQFFYEPRAWGYDPFHRGSAQVLYHPDGIKLNRRPPRIVTLSHREHPVNQHDRDPGKIEKVDRPDVTFEHPAVRSSSRLAFEKAWTLPSLNSPEIESLKLNEDDISNYEEFMMDFCDHEHRLLGHSQPEQGDMRIECQLASNGINCGGKEVIDEAKAKALQPGAMDWRLLLQIDCYDTAGMEYFWIRRQDLKRLDFSSVWGVFQIQ